MNTRGMNQSQSNITSPIKSRCLLFNPIHSKLPATKITACFSGSVQTQWAQGRKDRRRLTLPAGLTVGQCFLENQVYLYTKYECIYTFFKGVVDCDFTFLSLVCNVAV